MTDVMCACKCHRQMGDFTFVGVDVRDPLHAVSACPLCIDKHAPALSDLPFEPPKDWNPSQDTEDE